jgi:hypothetical protein
MDRKGVRVGSKQKHGSRNIPSPPRRGEGKYLAVYE